MEPGHEDREYHGSVHDSVLLRGASMEPGHEDREYLDDQSGVFANDSPQWSPVMKTGNTRGRQPAPHNHRHASMEPGHEDREYSESRRSPTPTLTASMEPGHEDREYLVSSLMMASGSSSLNGARS